MKKIVLFILLLVWLPLSAQFSIKGKIENYNDKPLLLKTYRNGVPSLIQRIVTDKEGNLEYQFNNSYNGVIILELPSQTYRLLSDNNDIKFKADINDSMNRIHFEDGINKKYSAYLSIVEIKDIAEKNLKPLKNFYQPNDRFYNDITNEINRIENLKIPSYTNAKLNYYINTKEYISRIGSPDMSTQQWMQEVLNHLTNDGMELENYGFLNEFVISYISMSTYSAKTKDEAGDKMIQAVQNLLQTLGDDTSRGQSVLAVSISLINSSGFKDIAKKLEDRANSLTCEINSALSNVIKETLSVGDEAPNFVFSNGNSDYDSLYEIKANKKLLIFWGSWCPHCVNEMPYIKEFYQGFKNSGGEIITFALDLEKEDYLPLIKDANFITVSDLLKWDSPVASLYGVNATPTMFLINDKNEIIKVGSRVSEFVDF